MLGPWEGSPFLKEKGGNLKNQDKNIKTISLKKVILSTWSLDHHPPEEPWLVVKMQILGSKIQDFWDRELPGRAQERNPEDGVAS